MRAIAVRRAGATAASLVGRVICHDVRDGAGKVAVDKGRSLDDAAARAGGARCPRLSLNCPCSKKTAICERALLAVERPRALLQVEGGKRKWAGSYNGRF